ncbi:MAG: glucoamylase family protein [Planctomycetota bacterium]
MKGRRFLCVLLVLLLWPVAAAESEAPLPVPGEVRVLSRHLRVDLLWISAPSLRYEVQRANAPEGPFEMLTSVLPSIPVHSDFLGRDDGEYYYRVRSLRALSKKEPPVYSAWSGVLKGRPARADAEGLLTEVQEASFRYFYDCGHPVSGLAFEGLERGPDLCSIGATGMGLFTLAVGIERGFVTRQAGAQRILKIFSFLQEKVERFYGAFPHWPNGTTGKVIPFGPDDDGADLVETAFLAEGLLFLREYFAGGDSVETEIRKRADTLWREIEWDWFAKEDQRGAILLWHWSPVHGFKKNMPVRGFNECQIVYLLALASPTHAVDPKFYWSGWEHARYAQKRIEFGITLQLHHGLGPPLFFTHYSYLGFDPRALEYQGRSYFDHFRDFALVQIKYAESKRDTFAGYGPLWGLTASYNPDGYKAHAPGSQDDGTIAPTAALASMPYVPEQSRACLTEMYEKHGRRLWGPFGFYDAFDFSKNWVAGGYLGIDVGSIAPMMENSRTGFCWKTFMKAPEIQPVIKRLARQ